MIRGAGGVLILAGLALSIPLNGANAQAGPRVAPDTRPPTGGMVTLRSAALAALTSHLRIAEASGTLASRREEIDEARAGYYPRISAGLTGGYDSRIRASWRPRPTISADQMLYDFGKVASAVEAARAGTREGRAQLFLAIDDLVRETAYAVVELQRSAALRQVALDQLASVTDISRLVTDRYQTGAATRSDALQAKARVEDARATLAQISATHQRWASALAYLMGRDLPVERVAMQEPDWLKRACSITGTHPDEIPAVMVARARRDRARADLHRAHADQLPTLSIGGDASTDIFSPTSDRSIYSVGLKVSSEIFSGGARKARARGAEYALGSANAGIARAELEARRNLAEARTQVPLLRDLLATLETRRADMAETGRLYRMQYLQMGTRTLVDLLNAEQELHQVGFDAANTAHDLRRLELDCLYNDGALRTAFDLDPLVAEMAS